MPLQRRGEIPEDLNATVADIAVRQRNHAEAVGFGLGDTAGEETIAHPKLPTDHVASVLLEEVPGFMRTFIIKNSANF